MAENVTHKRKILYGVNDKMPVLSFILTAIQHMLLNISIGLALPVAVSAAAGLDIIQSSSYLAASLFGMGVVSILQSIPGKYIGTGYLSMSVTDSVAIGCCCMAAEIGGIPLVLGLSICSCIFKYIFGHFAVYLKRIFSTEATGTLILLLGLSLVPTSFKYFLGVQTGFNIVSLIIAISTLLVMIICTFFIKALKPYTTLIGIAFGYILSLITGVFDPSCLSSLKGVSFINLPIYKDLAFDFDIKLLLPFLVVGLASVVDNISDFTATQAAADPDMKKANWKSIDKGVRAGGIGSALCCLIGGTMQSTASANIGVSAASGIVARKIAYLASALLILVSFFPGITGLLAAIPYPVLGAVILYSTCYILSSGFSTIQKIELDDRKIISIFLTFAVGVSTLIPNFYSFLPESVSSILISPMVLGSIVLLITVLLSKIGTKKNYKFSTGTNADEVKYLTKSIEDISKKWGTEKVITHQIQFAVTSLCEGLYEIDQDCKLDFSISYDPTQIKVEMAAHSPLFEQKKTKTKELVLASNKEKSEVYDLTISLLKKAFDNLKVELQNGCLAIKMDSDL